MTSKIGFRPPATPEQIAARLLCEIGTFTNDRMEESVLRLALSEFIFHRLNPDEQRRIGTVDKLFSCPPVSVNNMRAFEIWKAAANVPGANIWNENQDGFVSPVKPCLKRYEISLDAFLWVECDDPKIIEEYHSLCPTLINEAAFNLIQ
jgi:hypothetical protein